MIEASFKYIKILFLLLPVNIIATELESKDYIFLDFVPYQESRTSIGIKMYKQSKILTPIMIHNWFSKNLFFSGSLEQYKNSDKINFKHKMIFGYAYSFKNKNIKNLLFNIGYSKSRLNSDIDEKSNLLYGFLLNIKSKYFWFSPSYNIIYQENHIEQLTLIFTKSIKKNILIQFCYKFLKNDNNQTLSTPYLSIRYNI